MLVLIHKTYTNRGIIKLRQEQTKLCVYMCERQCYNVLLNFLVSLNGIKTKKKTKSVYLFVIFAISIFAYAKKLNLKLLFHE